MRGRIHNPIPSPGLASTQLLWGPASHLRSVPILIQVLLLKTLLSFFLAVLSGLFPVLSFYIQFFRFSIVT